MNKSLLQTKSTCCLVIILQTMLTVISSQQLTVPLLAVFTDEGTKSEEAFRLTVETANQDRFLLSRGVTIQPIIQHVPPYDAFNLSRNLCRLSETVGLGGLIAAGTSGLLGTMTSLSYRLGLPSIRTNPPEPGTSNNLFPNPYGVSLFPDNDDFSQALLHAVESLDWRTFVIIYEHSDALVRLKAVIKANNKLTPEGQVPFTIWQLTSDSDQRPLLKTIKHKSETHIILDCSLGRILPILHQAREVNLLTQDHSYVITSLDAHTVNLTSVLDRRANITTLRLIDPSTHVVGASVHDWNFLMGRRIKRPYLSPETVRTEEALMHDAVGVFSRAMKYAMKFPSIKPAKISCNENINNNTHRWNKGIDLASIMRKLEYDGMSGKIRFNEENGKRSLFTIDIVELTIQGNRKIGTWSTLTGMNYSRTDVEMERETYQAISNRTFRVASRLGEPYLRLRDGEGLVGNARYEGYSMDLIDEISKILNFTYDFYLVPDGEYGSFNKETKQWNGLIRELRERKADLAICDLTITYDRRSAVDFTMPFMTLGISILFAKPPKQSPSYFSFLSPFSVEVWMCMATALLSISLAMYFLSRCSPYEWSNPHPCNQNSNLLECNFSLQNCLWFTIGTLMQQGGDINPKAFSTRLVTGFWGFFVLLMISSYTANLAAFLTAERMESTITSVSDLAKQSRIKYGVVKGGSTANFFRDSNDSMYSRMWSAMESSRPTVFVKSNQEGMERVLKSKRQYALFMESTTIEYQMEQHCELMQVGATLDSKGYGIAMPSQFPYRTAISGAVLKLQESGRLLQLKNKWWREKHGRPACQDRKVKGPSNELGISSAGGVFLVLILGCSLAFLFSIIEFIWNVRKVAVDERISPLEALVLELKSCVSHYGKTKAIRKPIIEDDGTIPIDYINYLNSIR